MRVACIDIGSNTTRLLVADGGAGHLQKVEEKRAFTHIGRDLRARGELSHEKIVEVTEVVREQHELAVRLGAVEVVAVATAAVRRARNRACLEAALAAGLGVRLRVLSEEQEARYAFIGAWSALTQVSSAVPEGELGVVDVGGGSSEMIIGADPQRISWCASLALGSSELVHACLHSDPPQPAEIEAARALVRGKLAAIEVPSPARAVAVGGSAVSLIELSGRQLDGDAFAKALALLVSAPAADVAARFGLDVDRARLLSGGLLILEAVQGRFGVPLQVVGGGLREGVLAELTSRRATRG